MRNELELGKTYNFAGYQWVPVRIDKENQVAVMQSLGVTAGPWPGYSMPQFGNGFYYTKDISRMDISDCDEKTRALMQQIESVTAPGHGLYLASINDIDTVEDLRNNSVWEDALAAAATCGSLKPHDNGTWLSTVSDSSYAWCICSDGTINNDRHQNCLFVIAPYFNLDLSKVELNGGEIKAKGIDNTQKKTVRMRIMAVRYGYTVVEAESESAAIELANCLSDDQFDWSDPDDIQVVDDNIDD